MFIYYYLLFLYYKQAQNFVVCAHDIPICKITLFSLKKKAEEKNVFNV